MACPFFMPVGRLGDGGWTHAPRLPLGDPYHGLCHARPLEVFEPPEPAQREACNCGYARGRCDRFPPDSPADAVRFSITSDHDGRIQLVYILEKSHAPVEHGAFEYSIAGAQMSPGLDSGRLERQARAFLESYLRRRPAPTPYTCI